MNVKMSNRYIRKLFRTEELEEGKVYCLLNKESMRGEFIWFVHQVSKKGKFVFGEFYYLNPNLEEDSLSNPFAKGKTYFRDGQMKIFEKMWDVFLLNEKLQEDYKNKLILNKL